MNVHALAVFSPLLPAAGATHLISSGKCISNTMVDLISNSKLISSSVAIVYRRLISNRFSIDYAPVCLHEALGCITTIPKHSKDCIVGKRSAVATLDKARAW
jgi:hypothetical protein